VLPLLPPRVASASRANIIPVQLSTMSFAKSTCKVRRQRQKVHRQQASRARVPDTAAAVRQSANINSVPGMRDRAPLLGCARVHKKMSHPSYWHAQDKAGQAPAQHGMSQDSIEQYSMRQWTQMDQQHNNHTL
jgi:hypothetical protein